MNASIVSRALGLSLTSALVFTAAACSSTAVESTQRASQADDTRFVDNRQTVLWEDLMPHTDGSVGTDPFQAGVWHYNPTTGYVDKWTIYDLAPALSALLGAGDFSGGGNRGLLWSASSSASANDYWIWTMSGITVTGKTLIASAIPTDWIVVGMIDTNGDGKDDIVWRSQATGAIGTWLMDGSTVLARKILSGAPPSPNLIARAVGRFDGANASVVVQDSTNGAIYVSELNGVAGLMDRRSVAASVPSDWALVGTADFDGDGKTDLLWYDRVTGNTGIWRMDWFHFSYGYPGSASLDWVPVKAADVFGSGRAQIIWRNKFNGEVKVWPITPSLTRGVPVSFGTASCDWRIVGDATGQGDNQCLGPQPEGASCGWGVGCIDIANCFKGTCVAKDRCGNIGQQCCAGGHALNKMCPMLDDLGHQPHCSGVFGCLSCGVAGRPCCDTSWCGDGTTCLPSSASETGFICGAPPPQPPQGPCGHDGQSCCRSGTQCPGDNSDDAHTLQCGSAGMCERCGRDGGKCCRTDDTHRVCYYIDSVCLGTSNTCVGSGGVKPSPVDLTWAGFWTDPAGAFTPGQPFTLYWADQNIGSPASGAYSDMVTVSLSGRSDDPVQSDNVPMSPIPSGGMSTTRSIGFPNGLPAGTYFFELDVNFDGATPESRWDNNQIVFTRVVQ